MISESGDDKVKNTSLRVWLRRSGDERLLETRRSHNSKSEVLFGSLFFIRLLSHQEW